MANIRIDEARLRLIQTRQLHDNWGKNYQAAIEATPAEAPGISSPSILNPGKLGGRNMHTLSRPETSAALLALYNPAVWDLHEQRILYPGQRPHFLHGHAKAAGEMFKPLRGTLAVAEQLGCLSKHPKCRVSVAGESRIAPFPYVGDLLLFLDDVEGPYVVNWTIKDKYEDFRRRGPRPGQPRQIEPDQSTEQRHALEEQYYLDAGIPTRRVAGAQINHILASNLARCFKASTEVLLPDGVCRELDVYFQDHVGNSKPAYKLIEEAAASLEVDPKVVRTVLEQGIWHRRVKVDLFTPILFDRALRPQRVDPLETYREWFVREDL